MKLRTHAITLALILGLILSLAPGSAAAQKWPPPSGIVLDPPTLIFNGLGDRQNVTVTVEQVYSFFGADFTLGFDSSIIKVAKVTSGPVWDHADSSGAPQVQIGLNKLTYINTRFGSALELQESLDLATITFQSVSAVGASGTFSLTANIAEKSGVIHPLTTTLTYAYTVIPAAGVRGQALWPKPVTDHSNIPVLMTDALGNGIGLNVTDVNGFYPDPFFSPLAPFPIMPKDGQLRINPVKPQGLAISPPLPTGRIPALETQLTDCPYAPNLAAPVVRLVGGDVAPLEASSMGDNKIDISDLVLSASRFGTVGTDANSDGWVDGDVNRDDTVNILDIVIIANNFGQKGPICLPCPAACDLCS
jgi:hypothetical protein